MNRKKVANFFNFLFILVFPVERLAVRADGRRLQRRPTRQEIQEDPAPASLINPQQVDQVPGLNVLNF
jgi:hypothetical protein